MKNVVAFFAALLVVGALLYLVLGQMPAIRPPAPQLPPQKPQAEAADQAPQPSPAMSAATPSAESTDAAPAQADSTESTTAAPAPTAAPFPVATQDTTTIPSEDNLVNAVTIHVNASAEAGGDGSSERPFRTLDEARDAARAINSSVRVLIAAGHYMERNGFNLGPEDSGSPERTISYEAAPGDEVRISSGVLVPVSALAPVTDPALLARMRPEVRDKVRQVPLKEIGVRAAAFPDKFKGLELLEVQSNGHRLPIARWPDDGKFAQIEKVLDNGIAPPATGTFVYREDDPARWQEAVREGLWLRGFWRVPWVIEAVRVGQIDPEAKTITLAVAVPRGIGSKYHRAAGDGVGPGSGEEPWEAFNLIEEISQPGEWAVRFADDTLYILPPDDGSELIISDFRKPVISLRGVSHVWLRRLVVDTGLGDGISVEGGKHVLIAGCKVSNVSHDAISLQGGTNHTVLSCDTAETGYSGIAYTGGDRQTLTPSGHRIINNLITRAGLFFPAPGINGGLDTRNQPVGALVAHNRIHDCMNSGVVYAGNDNIFEYNDIYRIGLGSSDLGSFYTTGGWTSRGNIVRHNFVHHSMNANAFYVDDGDCGDTFFGNVAYKTESGGFVGGGSDQIFKNNIIIDSPRAMHIDARGIARGYTINDKRLRADLDSVPYNEPPWSEKYPEMVGILETATERPSRVVIEDNLFVGCEVPIRKSGKPDEFEGLTYKKNMVSDDMGMFVDPDGLDFSLKPDAAVFTEIPGFEQIPMARIGLYADAYRPVVPPRDMELLRTGKTDRGFDSQTDVNASNRPQ